MRKHTLNLFKIINLNEINFSYKIIEFDLSSSVGIELYTKNLQSLTKQISYDISGPAAPITINGKKFIAIPSDKSIKNTKINTAPFIVNLNQKDEIITLSKYQITNDNIEVIQKFLDFEIRKQLVGNNLLWRLNSNQFFLKKPVYSSEDSNIEVFGGFTYKTIVNSDREFFIVLDLAYKYIDKYFLPHYINSDTICDIKERYKGKHCLYFNGDDWYTIEIVNFEKKISEHEFTFNGKTFTVLDYIKNKTANHTFSTECLLNPSDLTLLYKYPARSMEPHHGATSLAKIIYQTNDKDVKSLHKISIKDPEQRFDSIVKNIERFFTKIKFNNTIIKVDKEPLSEEINYFNLPKLKYANNQFLEVGNPNEKYKVNLKDYPFERKKRILQNGILNNSPFDEQYLIVPESLEKGLVDTFVKQAETMMKNITTGFDKFKIIKYKQNKSVSIIRQINEIEKILDLSNAKSGFALFVLPDFSGESVSKIKSFHDILKKKFYPGLKFQCASVDKIQKFFSAYTTNSNQLIEYKIKDEAIQSFRSYLFNLMMEYLIINRKWPYALADNLNYDIYIGIDVHDRFAGFTFFYKNGENIYFYSKEIPKKNRSFRVEKIKSSIISEILYDNLKKHIEKYCPNPNAIVIIRDGKSFTEEEKALNDVINRLDSDGLINKENIKYGVVDLYKQSVIPLRVALHTDGHNKFENPRSGSYKILNLNEGFIFSTGFPFKIKGTSKALHLKFKCGNINFSKLLQDIFGQSMLAFSAPDRSNSLPITIKMIDTLLDPLAYNLDKIDEEVEEYEAFFSQN